MIICVGRKGILDMFSIKLNLFEWIIISAIAAIITFYISKYMKLNDYKDQEVMHEKSVIIEYHTNTVFNVCTNYVHIPPYDYRRKVCKLKTLTIEEKHQVLITDDIPPVIIHYHDCKFCKYELNKKGPGCQAKNSSTHMKE